jgi:PAS domain S-box-containing protein
MEPQSGSKADSLAEIELSKTRHVDFCTSAPVGCCTLSPKGRIEDVNPIAVKLLGIEKKNLVSQKFQGFIAPAFVSLFESYLLAVQATDSVQKCELKLNKKDGMPLYVSLESLSVKAEDGSVSLIWAVMNDITERKKAEMVLRESEERCRYLSSQLLVAQEAERRRIAGDLHDSIGHGLVNMKHLMEPFLIRMRAEGQEEDVKRLETFISILNNTTSEVKRMQLNLRPALLEDLGLLVTIGWLCREFGEAHPGIRIDQDIRIEEREIPDSLKVVIFRILQEALNNAAKHSKATLVHLTLIKGSKGIELTLSDNGQGFDVKETARNGLGLVSMSERTQLSNGSFSIDSIKGEGTTIQIAWAP